MPNFQWDLSGICTSASTYKSVGQYGNKKYSVTEVTEQSSSLLNRATQAGDFQPEFFV